MKEAVATPTVKHCKGCSRDLPFSAFQKDANEKFGLRFYCRECCSKRTRTPEYRAKGLKWCRYPTHKYASLKGRHFARWKDEAPITLEEYKRLTSQPCEYCGGPLPETSVGLDRIDISKGYSHGNVLPCCTWCNVARSDHFTVDEVRREIGPAIRRIRIQRGEINETT